MELADRGSALIVCPANNMLQLTKAEAFQAVHNAIWVDRCRETDLCFLSSDVTGERESPQQC